MTWTNGKMKRTYKTYGAYLRAIERFVKKRGILETFCDKKKGIFEITFTLENDKQ